MRLLINVRVVGCSRVVLARMVAACDILEQARGGTA